MKKNLLRESFNQVMEDECYSLCDRLDSESLFCFVVNVLDKLFSQNTKSVTIGEVIKSNKDGSYYGVAVVDARISEPYSFVSIRNSDCTGVSSFGYSIASPSTDDPDNYYYIVRSLLSALEEAFCVLIDGIE